MVIIKLPLLCSSLIKIQPSCCLRKTYSNRTHFRNLSESSSLFSNISKISSNSRLSVTGTEKIKALQPLTKKHIKLSEVEEKDREIIEKLKRKDEFYPYENPGEKLKTVFKNEVKVTAGQLIHFFTKIKVESLEPVFFDKFTDILIIGDGAVGLSIAHALRSKAPYGPKITVVGKDPFSFPRVSTNLGQSIVTTQLFNEEEEISILKYGAEFYSAFTRTTEVEDKAEFKLNYDPLGSLLLADRSNAEQIVRKNEMLKAYDIYHKIINIQTLKKKFSWLGTDNVLFGSLGMCNEGVIDPWTYFFGIKCKSINLGVQFVTAEIIDFGFENQDIKRAICKLPDNTYNSIDFGYCIIAGGVECLNLVKLLNENKSIEFKLRLPLEERLRYEYCFYSSDGPGLNTPMIINSDGTYFRRAGLTNHYIAGACVKSEDSENGPHQVFENKIKPFLINRIPSLKEIHLVSGWVDLYEYCFSNKVGITGPHPDNSKIIFALGFTHFGLLQVPALARAVMEYVFYDYYQTIDFTPFHIENLWRKQHLEADKRKRELLESQKRVTLLNN